MAFPQGPHHTESVLSMNIDGLLALGQKEATRQALAEINTSFSSAFDTNFKDLLVKHDREVQKKYRQQKRTSLNLQKGKRSRKQGSCEISCYCSSHRELTSANVNVSISKHPLRQKGKNPNPIPPISQMSLGTRKKSFVTCNNTHKLHRQ